jgi:hypothetical protein
MFFQPGLTSFVDGDDKCPWVSYKNVYPDAGTTSENNAVEEMTEASGDAIQEWNGAKRKVWRKDGGKWIYEDKPNLRKQWTYSGGKFSFDNNVWPNSEADEEFSTCPNPICPENSAKLIKGLRKGYVDSSCPLADPANSKALPDYLNEMKDKHAGGTGLSCTFAEPITFMEKGLTEGCMPVVFPEFEVEGMVNPAETKKRMGVKGFLIVVLGMLQHKTAMVKAVNDMAEADTYLTIRATAGMRKAVAVNQPASRALWAKLEDTTTGIRQKECDTVGKANDPNCFTIPKHEPAERPGEPDKSPAGIRIIPGQEEAFRGWITANYLYLLLQQTCVRKEIELQGGSYSDSPGSGIRLLADMTQAFQLDNKEDFEAPDCAPVGKEPGRPLDMSNAHPYLPQASVFAVDMYKYKTFTETPCFAEMGGSSVQIAYQVGKKLPDGNPVNTYINKYAFKDYSGAVCDSNSGGDCFDAASSFAGRQITWLYSRSFLYAGGQDTKALYRELMERVVLDKEELGAKGACLPYIMRKMQSNPKAALQASKLIPKGKGNLNDEIMFRKNALLFPQCRAGCGGYDKKAKKSLCKMGEGRYDGTEFWGAWSSKMKEQNQKSPYDPCYMTGIDPTDTVNDIPKFLTHSSDRADDCLKEVITTFRLLPPTKKCPSIVLCMNGDESKPGCKGYCAEDGCAGEIRRGHMTQYDPGLDAEGMQRKLNDPDLIQNNPLDVQTQNPEKIVASYPLDYGEECDITQFTPDHVCPDILDDTLAQQRDFIVAGSGYYKTLDTAFLVLDVLKRYKSAVVKGKQKCPAWVSSGPKTLEKNVYDPKTSKYQNAGESCVPDKDSFPGDFGEFQMLRKNKYDNKKGITSSEFFAIDEKKIVCKILTKLNALDFSDYKFDEVNVMATRFSEGVKSVQGIAGLCSHKFFEVPIQITVQAFWWAAELLCDGNKDPKAAFGPGDYFYQLALMFGYGMPSEMNCYMMMYDAFLLHGLTKGFPAPSEAEGQQAKTDEEDASWDEWRTGLAKNEIMVTLLMGVVHTDKAGLVPMSWTMGSTMIEMVDVIEKTKLGDQVANYNVVVASVADPDSPKILTEALQAKVGYMNQRKQVWKVKDSNKPEDAQKFLDRQYIAIDKEAANVELKELKQNYTDPAVEGLLTAVGKFSQAVFPEEYLITDVASPPSLLKQVFAMKTILDPDRESASDEEKEVERKTFNKVYPGKKWAAVNAEGESKWEKLKSTINEFKVFANSGGAAGKEKEKKIEELRQKIKELEEAPAQQKPADDPPTPTDPGSTPDVKDETPETPKSLGGEEGDLSQCNIQDEQIKALKESEDKLKKEVEECAGNKNPEDKSPQPSPELELPDDAKPQPSPELQLPDDAKLELSKLKEAEEEIQRLKDQLETVKEANKTASEELVKAKDEINTLKVTAAEKDGDGDVQVDPTGEACKNGTTDRLLSLQLEHAVVLKLLKSKLPADKGNILNDGLKAIAEVDPDDVPVGWSPDDSTSLLNNVKLSASNFGEDIYLGKGGEDCKINLATPRVASNQV